MPDFKVEVFQVVLPPASSSREFYHVTRYGFRMIKKKYRSFRTILLDGADWLHRLRVGKLYLPPRSLRDVGGDDLDDFEQTGQEFLGYFTTICGLRPDAAVLEIGSGSGRISLALTTYLSGEGTYKGVEIISSYVQWCRQHITKKNSNFTFVHADLFNKRYNSSSSQLAKDYQFSFPDASFDFIYLTSVFTHLLVEDMEHYLCEIQRLLKKNGKVLITCFLINEVQQQLAEQGKNQIHFQGLNDFCLVRDKEIPESAVAYREEYFLNTLEKFNFFLIRPIDYGTWSGREDGHSFQDMLVLSLTEKIPG